MSDVMLHGVLRMPPNLWRDDPIDVAQRHSRYVDASDRIRELEAEVERLRQDCAEAYQVVGAATLGPRVPFTEDDACRALDNLSAAASGDPRPHDDLLPWPKKAESYEAENQAKEGDLLALCEAANALCRGRFGVPLNDKTVNESCHAALMRDAAATVEAYMRTASRPKA